MVCLVARLIEAEKSYATMATTLLSEEVVGTMLAAIASAFPEEEASWVTYMPKFSNAAWFIETYVGRNPGVVISSSSEDEPAMISSISDLN